MDNRINQLKAVLSENQGLCDTLSQAVKEMALNDAKTVQKVRTNIALVLKKLNPARNDESVKLNLNWEVQFSLVSIYNTNSTAVFNKASHTIVISTAYWKRIAADERYEVILHELVHSVQYAFGEDCATAACDAEAYAISEYLLDKHLMEVTQ